MQWSFPSHPGVYFSSFLSGMQPAFYTLRGRPKAAEGCNWEYQLVWKRLQQVGQVTWLFSSFPGSSPVLILIVWMVFCLGFSFTVIQQFPSKAKLKHCSGANLFQRLLPLGKMDDIIMTFLIPHNFLILFKFVTLCVMWYNILFNTSHAFSSMPKNVALIKAAIQHA